MRIVNQMMFFCQAATKIKDCIDPDVDEEMQEMWEHFSDFFDVLLQSIEDVSAVGLTLMLKLLLERRDGALRRAKLSDIQKKALKYVSPKSKDGSIFSGRIQKFWAMRRDISSAKASEQFLEYVKGNSRKRQSSPNMGQGKSGSKQGYKKAKSSFRSNKTTNKPYTCGNGKSGGFSASKKASGGKF